MEQHFGLNCCTFTLTIYQLNSITTPNTISITSINIISLFKQWNLWELCVPLHLCWQNP